MAEPEEAAVQTGATQDTAAPDASTQADGSTSIEELQEMFRAVVREENAGIWGAMRQQLTPIQQKMAALDEITGAIEAVRGDNRQTRAMVQRIFQGTYTEEDAKVAMASVEEQARIESLQNENSKLKAGLEARQRAEYEAQQAAQAMAQRWTPRQITEFEWANEYGPRAERIAKRQGLAFADVANLLPQVPEGASKAQWLRWEEQTEELIKGEADKRLKADKPAVNTPAARPTSAAGEQLGDSLAYLKRHFEAHPVGRR